MSDRQRRGRGGHKKPRQPQQIEEPINVDLEANYHTEVKNFDDMKLDPALVHGIYSYGFKNPSEIQSLAIVPVHEGRNVIAQAQSGTGKTGAFGIGILSRIDVNLPITQALVLSPTRELTIQIYQFIKDISVKMKGIKISCLIGGDRVGDSIKEVESHPHIIVASPGRALDLIQKSIINCKDLTMLCMDEADELLGEGFLEQTSNILQYLPPTIQILLFSATFPPHIYNLTLDFVKDPIKILVKAEKLTLEGISQYYVDVGESKHKMATLIDIYSRMRISKAVLFANSREAVEYIEQQLKSLNFPVAQTHGGLPMDRRKEIMKDFRVGETRVLIATDLIARGIDVQQVTLVINFEMPESSEQYLHRIGRSGRYGRKGIAINIIDKTERRKLKEVETIYSTKIEELPENINELLDEANEQE